MLHITAPEARSIVNLLRDVALQHHEAHELHEQFARIVLPLLNPPPRRARIVEGDYKADGTVLAEFATLAGKRWVVFEFALIPGVMAVMPREQVLLAPE